MLKKFLLLMVFSLPLFLFGCNHEQPIKSPEYDVIFFDYEGTVIKTELVKEGHFATAPTLPNREGYRFIGWNQDFSNVKADIMVYPLYEEIIVQYKVEFLDYDDQLLKEEIVIAGNNATPPINPFRYGYVFINWNQDYRDVNSDLTIKAIYEEETNVYSVTFYDHNDMIMKEEYVLKNSNATAPTLNLPDGYKFLGWDKSFENINANIIVKPLLSFEYVVVNLFLNDNLYKTIKVVKDAVYTFENIPSLDFMGWYTDATTQTKVTTPSIKISESIDFYGKFNYNHSFNYALNADQTLTITGFNGDYRQIMIIPSSINGVKVSSISSNAFKHFVDIEHLIIEEGILYIGEYAFLSCVSLKTVIIPNSVKFMLKGAFKDCINLTDIKLSESLNEICDNMFEGCTNLKTIIIPNSVSILHPYIFRNSGLTTIHIPSNVKIISSSFQDSKHLKTITIDEGLEKITDSAFSGCSALEEIKLPNSITSLGIGIFGKCSSLKIMTVPFIPGLTSGTSMINFFSHYEFDNCYPVQTDTVPSYIPNSLEEVNLTKGGIKLPFSAFAGLKSVKRISFPNDIIHIGGRCFAGMESLEEIFIPKSVLLIYNDAFMGCTNLSIFTDLESKGAYWQENWNSSNCPIYYKTTKEGIKYQVQFVDYDGTILNEQNVIINKGATAPINLVRPGFLFKGWDQDFCQVTQDLTVNAVYEQTNQTYLVSFYGYNGVLLKEEEVDENGQANPPFIPRVNGYEFCGWDKKFDIVTSNLIVNGNYKEVKYQINLYINNHLYKSMLLSKDAQFILDDFSGINFFKGWYLDSKYSQSANISNIVFDHQNFYCKFDYNSFFTYTLNGIGVTITGYIGSYQKILVIPNYINGYKVISIGEKAFSQNNNIEHLVIPQGILYIGGYAFENCYNLKVVSMENSNAISIGQGAFQNCVSLEKIDLPTTITTISQSLFEGCSSLKSFNINKSITLIDSYAFSKTGLQNIYIPSNVLHISFYVFKDCYSLTSITFSEGLKTIGYNALANCQLLTEVTLPNSLRTIYSGIFSGCSNLRKLSVPYLGETVNKQNREFCKLFGSSSYENCYKIEYSWNNFYYIPKSLIEVTLTNANNIPEYAFEGMIYIEQINLPNTINMIRTHSFKDCTGLKEIFIPNSVLYISSSAFTNCTLTIKCEHLEKPSNWGDNWHSNCVVVWGQTIN